MIFTAIIFALVGAIVFFHYLQGFFSATISAILAAVAAVLAFSYHETVVESVLGGKMANYAHGMVLAALFAVIYLLLRVMFDMMVPGNVRVPAVVDKVGGAVMGLVAAIFATGVVAVAAQQLPFPASIGGYTRYETKDREVIVPGDTTGSSKQTAVVESELTDRTFNPSKEQGILLLPVDDVLVGTVSRLSAGGSLAGAQPLTEVHPNYLQELFAQRLGSQPGSNRVAANLGGKEMARVEGLYQLPSIPHVNDAEFKALREGSAGLKSPLTVLKNQMLLVVRVMFTKEAADKDSLVRLGPGAVRLVADGPDGARVNYYPIGTMQGTDRLYANKVDDYLFLNVVEGDKGADFVFQVDREGFLADGSAAGAEQIADGTFLEVKRLARVDLGGKKVETGLQPSPDVMVMRKELNREDGGLPPPVVQMLQGGKMRQDEAGRRSLVGTWQGKAGGKDVTLKIEEAEMFLDVKTPVVNTTESFKGFWQPQAVKGNVITVDLNNLKSQTGKNIKETVDFTMQGQEQFTFKVTDATAAQVLGEGPVTLKRTASGERR